MYTSISCPVCKLDGSLSFYEGTENGAPHASGFWPMQVRDIDQICACELTDEQWHAAEHAAWAPIQQAEEECICECGHWQEEHTPHCEACSMNDPDLYPHVFTREHLVSNTPHDGQPVL